MKNNKWFAARRYLLPIWVAACMIASLPISAQADTTYDFANLVPASGGLKPQGKPFIVNDTFVNDTTYPTTIYYSSRVPSITGIFIKADQINLGTFDLNDMGFLVNPGPVSITSLKVTATRSVGEPVSATVGPVNLASSGDSFTLSGLGADLTAFTNVTELQFEVSMAGQDPKVMDLDFAFITISNEVIPPAITTAFGTANIPLNGSTSLTFVINNPNGSATLNGISFNDILPAGLVVAAVPDLNSSCGGSIAALPGSASVSLAGAVLAASTSCTVSVSVQGTTPGVKNNSVTVTSENGSTGNSSNASLAVLAADLALVNSATAAIVPLQSLTYNISLTNNGPSAAQAVSINDALPANTTFKSLSMGGASGWEFSTPAVGGTGTVSCTKALVASGETAVFQVVVQIGAGAANGGTISNTAVASTLTIDPDPSNNASTTTSTVSYPVRAELPEITYFPTLASACADASTPNIIKARGIAFTESLRLDKGKSLTLKGGYDSAFSDNGTTTTVAGPLIVVNGSLILEKIVIK